jgi:hypothetical protein
MKRLRHEMQKAAVEADLAEDFDDFDDVAEDSYDEVSDIY